MLPKNVQICPYNKIFAEIESDYTNFENNIFKILIL